MKNVVLVCTVVLAVIWSVAAGAQAPGNSCSQIVQNINDAYSGISGNADAYWTHRANFVDLVFGQSRLIVPNALQVAEQEKGQADAVKAGMPRRLNNLKGLLAAAQAQNCLSPAQLSAQAEPATKSAKRVNFDQFPEELPFESSVDRAPPEMPR